MSDNILPCKCGEHSESLQVYKFSTGCEYWVKCFACDRLGDSAETPEDAIKAWNDIIKQSETTKDEIDDTYYCSGGFLVHHDYCMLNEKKLELGDCDLCSCRHRKHPTPEQFREEYGRKYPDDGAINFIEESDTDTWWDISTYKEIDEINGINGRQIINGEIVRYPKQVIVCACTPFGMPDKNWRP